jgi:hypothetical protein
MMHFSIPSSHSTIAKKVCMKHHPDAYPEDLMMQDRIYCTLKINVATCRDCVMRRQQSLFHSINSTLRLLV